VRRIFSFRIEIIYKRTKWQSWQLRLKQKDTSRSFRAFLGNSFVKCQDEKTCQENLLQMYLSSKYAHQSCWPRLKICVINWCFRVDKRALCRFWHISKSSKDRVLDDPAWEYANILQLIIETHTSGWYCCDRNN